MSPNPFILTLLTIFTTLSCGSGSDTVATTPGSGANESEGNQPPLPPPITFDIAGKWGGTFTGFDSDCPDNPFSYPFDFEIDFSNPELSASRLHAEYQVDRVIGDVLVPGDDARFVIQCFPPRDWFLAPFSNRSMANVRWSIEEDYLLITYNDNFAGWRGQHTPNDAFTGELEIELKLAYLGNEMVLLSGKAIMGSNVHFFDWAGEIALTGSLERRF